MRMIHSVYACIIVRGRFYIEHVAYNRRLCAFTAQTSDSRTFTRTNGNASERRPPSASSSARCVKVMENMYTLDILKKTPANGSLSHDETAEPTLEACHSSASEGRNERPARARASARTAKFAGRRRSHLAACLGHLHRAEAEPEAACRRAQSAGERRVRAENESEEG